jgi:hypothetical protein
MGLRQRQPMGPPTDTSAIGFPGEAALPRSASIAAGLRFSSVRESSRALFIARPCHVSNG